jgi:hypothetical protein
MGWRMKGVFLFEIMVLTLHHIALVLKVLRWTVHLLFILFRIARCSALRFNRDLMICLEECD